MLQPSSKLSQPDLSICEQEPIHIPGFIEPNGVLIAVDDRQLRIVQVSANTSDLLGMEPEVLLEMHVSAVVDARTLAAIEALSQDSLSDNRRYVQDVHAAGSTQALDLSLHRKDGLLILEFEPTAGPDEQHEPAFIRHITDSLIHIQGKLSLQELCGSVVRSVRQVTGFDRVMVYRFLEDGTGAVIAEDKREDLNSYLGLRYPASDIPPQARRLYLLNRIRLKSDVAAERVPMVPVLNPVTGAPLDMTLCILRAMSPVHVEYLRNMGVQASMSISIVRDGKLDGLIACHHLTPRTVPHRTRVSCEVLAGVFSCYIPAAQDRDNAKRAHDARTYLNQLRDKLQDDSGVSDILGAEGEPLTALADAAGVAVYLDETLSLFGATTSAQDTEQLIQWLDTHQTTHLFHTDKLSELLPAGESVLPSAATGLLSMKLALQGRDFILWFRPPASKVVEWAGNPDKPVEETEAGKRISPRLSFERWTQTIGDRSEEWTSHTLDFAASLRQIVAEALLTRRYEEVGRLNKELERSNIELDAFAYAASHDLQEPLRTIRAYSQLLTRRAEGALAAQDRKLLAAIEDGTSRMSTLLSALLEFAQVGGAASRGQRTVELADALSIVLISLKEAIHEAGATITHDPLPAVKADPEQLNVVIQNLVSNALKYRRADTPATVHIFASRERSKIIVGVHDNGSGFDPRHAETVFAAFKRLHGREIPGTGLGLALCKRIIEAHGGRIWAESPGPGQGATFWFTIPAGE